LLEFSNLSFSSRQATVEDASFSCCFFYHREYIQLHRDSTIGQITLQPSLEDGRVVWKDSPLVRAVSRGLSLVVDEADKVRRLYKPL